MPQDVYRESTLDVSGLLKDFMDISLLYHISTLFRRRQMRGKVPDGHFVKSRAIMESPTAAELVNTARWFVIIGRHFHGVFMREQMSWGGGTCKKGRNSNSAWHRGQGDAPQLPPTDREGGEIAGTHGTRYLIVLIKALPGTYFYDKLHVFSKKKNNNKTTTLLFRGNSDHCAPAANTREKFLRSELSRSGDILKR